MASKILLAFFLVFLAACSSSDKNSDMRAVEILFREAEEAFEDERFLISEEKFKDITNRFPYSEYAVKARLRLADTYIAQERFVEAAAQYEIFRDLHPKHEKSDYVVFQIGESHYFLLPDHVGRDHTFAFDALVAYRDLLMDYRSSQYLPKARERVKEIRTKLGAKEKYIADWYMGQDLFLSAWGRYHVIWKKYKDVTNEQEVLAGLVGAQYGLIESGKKVFKESKQFAKILRKKYPDSDLVDEADKILKR